MNIQHFHKPQIIKENGKPAFAVLPYDEYEALLDVFEEFSDVEDFKRIMAGEAENIPSSIAERLLDGENPLKVWREYRNLTQQQVARSVGISIPFLCQIETNKREPSLKVYRNLASVLKVSLDLLVNNT